MNNGGLCNVCWEPFENCECSRAVKRGFSAMVRKVAEAARDDPLETLHDQHLRARLEDVVRRAREEVNKLEREQHIAVAEDFASMIEDVRALPKRDSIADRRQDILFISANHPLAAKTIAGRTILLRLLGGAPI